MDRIKYAKINNARVKTTAKYQEKKRRLLNAIRLLDLEYQCQMRALYLNASALGY